MYVNKIKTKMKSNISEFNTEIRNAINTINKNPKRPLGKFNPWAWCLEPVRGCNLTCWHCPARLLPRNEYKYMTKKTWINTWKIIRQFTPYCRVEMANTGEPTLHPDILEFILIATQISPNSQIQITTNGTQLLKNKITYKQLFDAGVNVVYVDMYGSREKHIELAKNSGYQYFLYYNNKDKPLSPWVFHNNRELQFIALSEIPDNWPIQKINRGGLGTFLNNIDFNNKRAKEWNIKPVINAPNRRCNQPMKYVQVTDDGTYLMCCQDVFNDFGIKNNVNEGIDGFLEFWLGKRMQETRKLLFHKERNKHPICSKCNICFSRCDMKFWEEELFEFYWDGKKINKK